MKFFLTFLYFYRATENFKNTSSSQMTILVNEFRARFYWNQYWINIGPTDSQHFLHSSILSAVVDHRDQRKSDAFPDHRGKKSSF